MLKYSVVKQIFLNNAYKGMLSEKLKMELDDIQNQSEVLDAEIDFNDTEIQSNREDIDNTYVNNNIDIVSEHVVNRLGPLSTEKIQPLLRQCFKDVSINDL